MADLIEVGQVLWERKWEAEEESSFFSIELEMEAVTGKGGADGMVILGFIGAPSVGHREAWKE